MELEVREVDAAARPRLRTHVDSYRAELGRLSQEFLKVRSPPFQDGFFGQDDLYGAGVSMKEEQKLRLLDNSERIERTGHHHQCRMGGTASTPGYNHYEMLHQLPPARQAFLLDLYNSVWESHQFPSLWSYQPYIYISGKDKLVI
uniref:Uncharacterized protein n=1 Tax=Timema cristinae TaxID=61476 RepID=A0A7R9DEC6_TIMCR|nr:unnamed protein product [Timema cristinae]